MSSLPVFGYWKLRGLGQFIRLLLNYVGEEYEEKYYLCGSVVNEELPKQWPPGDDSDFGKSWFKEDKDKLGLVLPNLPYYKDGKVSITQSTAIMKHLARKYNLEAKTEEEKIRLDMIFEEFRDVGKNFASLCYNPKFHELKDDYYKNFVKKLKQFADFLGDRPWFAGSYITWVDFYLYEFLDRHRLVWPDCYAEFPKLAAFLDRFEALPKIKAYMESDDYLKKPLYMPFASFGC